MGLHRPRCAVTCADPVPADSPALGRGQAQGRQRRDALLRWDFRLPEVVHLHPHISSRVEHGKDLVTLSGFLIMKGQCFERRRDFAGFGVPFVPEGSGPCSEVEQAVN